jgi:hypothetical protein
MELDSELLTNFSAKSGAIFDLLEVMWRANVMVSNYCARLAL